MLPPPLPPDLFDSLPQAVQAYIRALEGLTARVAELEAKLNQNSSNSSKPPSSDGPHVRPAPETVRPDAGPETLSFGLGGTRFAAPYGQCS